MRISDVSSTPFTLRAAANFFGLPEYSIDVPVVVKWNVDVG